MSDLQTALKSMVIDECRVANVSLQQIRNDRPIIGGDAGLPLDSLDAVEIVTALERHFDIKLENAGASRHLFKSFDAMSAYLEIHAKKDKIQKFMERDATTHPPT